MNFDFAHSLSKEDARARIEALGEYLGNRHGIRVVWDGDTGRFNGKYLVVSIEGKLTFGEGKVMFEGKDPGLLWRRKATDYLREKLEQYLDPGTPLEALPRSK